MPFICGVALCSSAALGAEGNDDAELATARSEAMKTYKGQVAPFIATYCARCHSGKKQKGGVTFQSALKNPGSPSFRTLWKRASAQIKTHDMPPEDEDKQPSEQERKAIVDWIAGMKRLSPKDPGLFVIRRLSKVEYGNTLHDLFGVDPQIAHDLPDEVFGAGYTNSLSPLLMEQYLAVANEVLNQIIAPPGAPPTAVQQRLFGVDPGAGADRKAAARKVAQSLARLAYRRPPSEAEIDVLLRVFALATDQGKSYPGGVAADAEGDPGVAAVSLHHARRRRTRPAMRTRPVTSSRSTIINWPRASRTCCGRRCPMRSCRRWPMPGSCTTRQVLAGAGPPPDGRSALPRLVRWIRRAVARLGQARRQDLRRGEVPADDRRPAHVDVRRSTPAL